jgi:hypothetical protein
MGTEWSCVDNEARELTAIHYAPLEPTTNGDAGAWATETLESVTGQRTSNVEWTHLQPAIGASGSLARFPHFGFHPALHSAPTPTTTDSTKRTSLGNRATLIERERAWWSCGTLMQ